MLPNRKQPIDFRKNEVTYVMQRWKSAESCSLVGIGSAGKSNLIQHLSDDDVQAHYLEDRAANFKAIVIDPNLLAPLPPNSADEAIRCWAGYELLMHRLFLAFYPFEELGSDAERFYETYQALQDGTNPLYASMGIRYFELGLQFFLRRDIQIVFMFDEFEAMLSALPVKFFLTLRGLRDAHKRQLSFATFSRAPLPVLAERMNIPALDFEPFAELFTDNVYYIGPYSDADARRMIDDLLKRANLTYSEAATHFLLDTSGRYAGLLRASARAFEPLSTQLIVAETIPALTAQLAAKLPVRTECQTIWSSLTPIEQRVLKSVARLMPHNVTEETERGVTMLVQKRLLKLDRAQQKLEIQPPLFQAFVATNPGMATDATV